MAITSDLSARTTFWSPRPGKSTFQPHWVRSPRTLAAQMGEGGESTTGDERWSWLLEACGPIGGRRILDVGYGQGELARIFDVMGGQVDAFDISNTFLPLLREEAPGVHWHVADVTLWEPPQHMDPYDLVVVSDLWEQVDIERALKRLLAAIAPGGRLVVQHVVSDRVQFERMLEGWESGSPWTIEMYVRDIYHGKDVIGNRWLAGPWSRRTDWGEHRRRDRIPPAVQLIGPSVSRTQVVMIRPYPGNRAEVASH